MKRLTPYLIFVLLTGGLVAFIYKDRIFPQEKSANAAGGAGKAGGGNFRRGDQVIPVSVQAIKTANVPVYLSGVGTVQAYNTATVRAQVSGRLTDVGYQEGQDVKGGDVLATIDPVLFQAAYDQAVAQKAKDEATLANARLDEKRYSDLVKTNSASKQQADTAVATVRQNEAQVQLDQALVNNAKANLDYTKIKAPITGRTGIRLVDKGNLVSAADATGIVVITQLKPIAIVFTLPEKDVADVLTAQNAGPVSLQAVAGGTVIGEGTLLVVDNQIDQTTGTVKIKGTFPNQENKLWPGQFVNVKLKLKTLDNAIVVPSVALQQGANGSYVFLVTPENTAKIAYVKIIQEGEKRSVVGEGVKPGDTVVTSGFASLQEGSKVKVESGSDKNAGAVDTSATPGNGGGGTKHQKGRHKEAAAEGGTPETAQAVTAPAESGQGPRKP